MHTKRITSEVETSTDRLIELPDDIISKIISSLTLKQAVTTSATSTRWRDLWKHLYSGFIDFDGSTTIQDLKRRYDKYRCRHQSLTTVSLKNVGISPETFEHLLGCPNLEELNVADCLNLMKDLCYKTPLHLRVQSFNLCSLSLKKLTLWVCGNTLDHWNIVAPNLLSFTYCPTQFADPNLVLEYVPRLNYLNIKRSHWCRYGTNLLQLQELVCDMCYCYYCDCNIKWPIKLPNLKNITIKHTTSNSSDFNDFVAHLKAAPLLENLIVELPWDKKFTEESWENAKDLRYNNLKTVKLIGYGATMPITDVDIIWYFLSRAPLLETIIIDPCEPRCLGTSEEIHYRQSSRYLEGRKPHHQLDIKSSLECNCCLNL
ncbi:hypothetical protein ACFE04_026697 [Oxalis oulophora]